MCLRCASPIDYGKLPMRNRMGGVKKMGKNNKINSPRRTQIVLVVLPNGHS